MKKLIIGIVLSVGTPGVVFAAGSNAKIDSKSEAKAALKSKHDALAPEISLEELRALVESKDKKPMTIIDANSEKSYKDSRIPGAVHFAKIEADMTAALPKDKNALIVAYCGSPMCTAWEAPAEKAKALGYTNIRHLKAGIKGWNDAKYPTHKG